MNKRWVWYDETDTQSPTYEWLVCPSLACRTKYALEGVSVAFNGKCDPTPSLYNHLHCAYCQTPYKGENRVK